MTRIDLGNRVIEDDGTVICTSDAMMEMLYSGNVLDGVFCQDLEDSEEWTASNIICDTQEPGPIHADGPAYAGMDWYQHWFTPEPYASMDITSWCKDRCCNQQEIDRIEKELAEFKHRGMIPVMLHLIYCVDHWRERGIFWGVGRGSSVCSLVLHKIGINRINPLEHGLVLGEWLK
jgi:hypothetical protein